MSSNDEQSFRSFSYDDELAKARWYKDDLNAGGWREVENVPKSELGATFWIKTFPDQEIPIKVLMQFDMPLSAKQLTEVLSPRNMEHRKKWDKAFVVKEVLEEYPENGGHLMRNVIALKWPLSDRDYVLFVPPTKEIEWYGKQAFHVIYINAWHPSKPAHEGGCVRATNGGNFSIVIPNESNPDNACTVFGLSQNAYNGWIPHSEWLIKRKLPKALITYYENIVEGHKMFFESK